MGRSRLGRQKKNFALTAPHSKHILVPPCTFVGQPPLEYSYTEISINIRLGILKNIGKCERSEQKFFEVKVER